MSRRSRKKQETPPADDLAAEFRREGKCENCGVTLPSKPVSREHGTYCDAICCACAWAYIQQTRART